MSSESKTVCLVSPLPPPYGGMAIQAGKLLAVLEQCGFKVIPVRTNAEFPVGLKWVKKVPGVRTIANLCIFQWSLRQALKYSDVVYFLTGFFNFFFWVTYPALVQIKLSGKPVILSARGGAAAQFFKRWGRISGPVLRKVDCITTPSGFLQQVFIDAFDLYPVIIPNIADLSQFHFIRREIFRPKLIVTRSLEGIYNVACVLKAFQKIYQKYPDAELNIVGDGSLRTNLYNLSQELGVQDAVHFHGRVSHDTIQELYQSSDIFVNASNVDNLPGTILEAYACGLPVVSTRAGGIPYIVCHEKTGLLVDRNDCNSLANQVERLIQDPSLAIRLVNNGLAECQKYSQEEVRKRLKPILVDLIKNED